MAGEIAIVTKAKEDLIAAGYPMQTDCDAYKITNLAAQRAGWKVVEKIGGANCQNRKVDGVAPGDGNWYDCQVNAGPPLNANTPAWNSQGPVGSLVLKDPYDWPDPAENPNPEPEPVPNPSYDEVIRKLDNTLKMVLILDTKIDAMAIQADENTKKIQTQIHDLVEDMEESITKYMPLIVCRFNASPAPAGGVAGNIAGTVGSIIGGLFNRSRARRAKDGE